MSQLAQPVTIIKGVGEETAKQLGNLGIYTVGDLLEYYPFRYEDYRIREIHEVNHDERITLAGVIHSEPSVRYFGKKKTRLSVRVLINNVLITAVFFNQGFIKKQLQVGSSITITGKWDRHRLTLTVNEFKIGDVTRQNELAPVYSVGGNLKIATLKKIIYQGLKEYANEIQEILPPFILEKYKLLPKKEAVLRLHYPQSTELVKQARRRMVYEEFLLFQLKMQSFRKFKREQTKGLPMPTNRKKVEQFIDSLPFPLTGAQQRVVNEIMNDLSADYRMNRLLQGDVGSGKTVVAAVAMYATVDAGFQAALMVPTEILAEQHVSSIKELLSPLGIEVALLSGSVKGKKRREQLEKIKAGEIHVVIGTHALIQDDVHFHKLGLVITDEQHRFGVEQRRILRDKGENPDVLFMTATPIPRTLAISVFGDMDVSVIDEMPAGRKTIETYWVKHDMLERVLHFIEKEIKQGHQAYVICPLIEESEKLDVQNAIDVHAILQTHFKEYKVGLMHGRLHPSEKDEVMEAFSKNETQILVSTTVVEVGVNVPNSTVMLIYDAERFGLAQLHQLRGRVGRGEHQSYCILLADPKSDVGKERMRIMTETNDGFTLSERDLELRGPGDFFGQKQSGLPNFKVADVVHDYRALEVARQDAVEFVNSTHFWEDREYKALVYYLEEQGILSGEKLD
ncbi:ATP-dependent DNA helicase RecG [Alkalihalobacterium chitinilyticum]|uniref:ATP-dependent DNA helicase RecG n=1 Tax=Alkalihalobacterium chitinilyticum TaxID=2980103 RepID=A0ABT5VC18_9BACI|nr:ATP-dependent DNA helicase RecG [Alkalihalobacterium chitinilyticum]MDE5413006.1 ATP-dependent DNA helicase RecG [Alkalihalobacterium chitinilyticum]